MTVFFGTIRACLVEAFLVLMASIRTSFSRRRISRTVCEQRFLAGYCSLFITTGLLLWLAIASPTLASPAPDQPAAITPELTVSGTALFTENCAACHANGGNIIRRGKNLKQRAMMRNGYGEVSAIASIVTQGKGVMPSYAKKLSSKEISAIAQYVHEQSEAGW